MFSESLLVAGGEEDVGCVLNPSVVVCCWRGGGHWLCLGPLSLMAVSSRGRRMLVVS